MMLHRAELAFALALTGTLAGCATDASEQDLANDPAGDSNPAEPAPATAEGTFTLHSKFDLATNLPGKVGTVVNVIISATDDSNDPVKFIYEKVIDGLGEGTVKNALRGAGPLVTGYLNDRLLSIAPTFVTRMVTLGNRFGEIAKNFGTTSQLVITKGGSGYLSTHTTTGVEFKLVDAGQLLELQFPFEDYGMPSIRVDNVGVALESSGKLTIAPHAVSVSFGQLLRIGVDDMILPLIDDDARNLGELFQNLIDCRQVGMAIFDALRLGSAGAFEAACRTGLGAGATFIYQKIEEIDATALQLDITGVAKAIDRNRDGKMDDLQRGAWTGTVKYATSPATLGTATFLGRAP
ncbi:MAG TPA: hypothetical protein PKU97_13620 [Kofleriaceae bacterium]|nr:hypothetical protein [Kofleriaceae bacterium]